MFYLRFVHFQCKASYCKAKQVVKLSYND